jgi:hypothetical protein
MGKESTHGNVSMAHHFRKNDDGIWERRLMGDRNIKKNWRKLSVEHTDTHPRKDKAGRVWQMPISNIWTWR